MAKSRPISFMPSMVAALNRNQKTQTRRIVRGDPNWADWQPTARAAYAKLFDQINGQGAWDKNPWVWVITFRKI